MEDAALPSGEATTAQRAARGFTMVELLITMTVVAILLAIAAPSFRSFVQNTRLTTQASTLVYSLNFARDQAVKLNTAVEVCVSSDQATCTAGTWASGWIVCYPIASCPTAAGPPAPTVLQVAPGLSSGNTVTEEVSGATSVTYFSNGQTNTGAVGVAEQFVFCDSRGPAFGQDVEINLIGRIESAPNPGQTVAGAPLAAC